MTRTRRAAIAGVWAAAVGLGAGAAFADRYEEPKPHAVETAAAVDEAPGALYERLGAAFGREPYTVVDRDDAKRTVTVRIDVEDPTRYIDCGTSYRSAAAGGGETVYPTAGSAQYTFTDSNGQTFTATRVSELEGRALVSVEPQAQGSQVDVIVLYAWTLLIEYTDRRSVPIDSKGVRFHLGSRQPLDERDGQTPVCYATGRLESELLARVRARP